MMRKGRKIEPTDRPVNPEGNYLVLELTNDCPLRCIHCVRSIEGYPHFLSTGFMKKDLPARLVRELKEKGYHFDNLILFWLGEPLLHPHFLEILDDLISENSCDKKVFECFEIHTNALLLNERVAQRLLEPLPFPLKIHFSIDAIKRETYIKIKGGDHLERVMKNVESFMRMKGEMGGKSLSLVLQFIISSINVNEAVEFSTYWQEKGREFGLELEEVGVYPPPLPGRDFVFFRQKDCPTIIEQERENRIYFDFLHERGLLKDRRVNPEPLLPEGEQKKVCSGFFKSPVIGWDGRVTVCTRDNLFELSIGDLNKESFHEIWWQNERLWEIRERVAKRDYSELPMCRSCFIPQSANYSELTQKDLDMFMRNRF